jgi:flavin reductase (DIM6/NTAB) family NADH-FMN oxidoreductase RutF
MSTIATHARFRTLMSRFVTGVTVIAVASEDRQSGVAAMTASAVCPVSLDPLLLLFCVRNESSFLSYLKQSKTFSVNVLSSSQDAVSRYYGGQAHHGIEGTWNLQTASAPILDGANATFVCHVANLQKLGDHHVVVGEVVGMHSIDPPAPALVYVAGQYLGVELVGQPGTQALA